MSESLMGIFKRIEEDTRELKRQVLGVWGPKEQEEELGVPSVHDENLYDREKEQGR